MEELIQDLLWLAEKHREGRDDNQKRVAAIIYSVLGALQGGGIAELYNLIRDFTARDIQRVRGMFGN